jgi:hypothetical protein
MNHCGMAVYEYAVDHSGGENLTAGWGKEG